MPSRSNTSLAALLLTQRLIETPATPLKASEYWSLLARVGDPASLLGLDTTAIARTADVDGSLAERISQLLDAATAVVFQLDQAEQSGLRVVTSVDDGYPTTLIDRLGRGAPPLLYLAGDPGLLRRDLLGIVGSRDVGEAGAEVARSAALQATSQGFGVVSGGAKGVDRLAMQAGLEAGGTAVCVLADSLVRTLRDRDVRRAITDGSLCLCTPYKPAAGFSVPNAMGRNKIIYALSRATVVVAAEAGTGGTWAGAFEAIRQHLTPVLVWSGEGAGSGNTKLVELGAHSLHDTGTLFPLPPPTLQDADSPSSQLAMEI